MGQEISKTPQIDPDFKWQVEVMKSEIQNLKERLTKNEDQIEKLIFKNWDAAIQIDEIKDQNKKLL